MTALDTGPVPSGRLGPAAARRAVLSLGRRMRHGTVVIDERGAGGEGCRSVTLGRGEPTVRVTVEDPRAYGAWLRGSQGLGESYRAGWWGCDDLTGLLRLLFVNLAGVIRFLDRAGSAARPLVDPVARLRMPDKAADRRNIRAHYDIGNDFYERMLDETMTYSCAVFEHPDASLAEAQTAKLDRMCRRLRLGAADHVLEIGTGWGGFAVHAASTYGCRVTTTTISEAQRSYAVERVARAGLGDRVTVLDADYRDLRGRFDKLVSVEMIEAVDWREHDRYFATCARLVGPRGLVGLQAIVIADLSFDRAKHHDDFVRRHVFPGGCLPSVTSIGRSAAGAGLRMIELEDIGVHYPETLRRWRAKVHAPGVAATLDPAFLRMWDFYLTYCEAAFLERHVSDVQVVLAGPAWRDQPPR